MTDCKDSVHIKRITKTFNESKDRAGCTCRIEATDADGEYAFMDVIPNGCAKHPTGSRLVVRK